MLVQEENEAEEDVLDGVSAVIAVALRKWGDAAFPFVDPLMPAIGQVPPVPCSGSRNIARHPNQRCWRLMPASRQTLLTKRSRAGQRPERRSGCDSWWRSGAQLLTGERRTVGERRIGVCVMDDLLEHSPAGGAQYLPQIIPILLQFAQHKVPPPAAAALTPSPAALLPLRPPAPSQPAQGFCIPGAMVLPEAGAVRPAGGGAPLALEAGRASSQEALGRPDGGGASMLSGTPGLRAAVVTGGGGVCRITSCGRRRCTAWALRRSTGGRPSAPSLCRCSLAKLRKVFERCWQALAALRLSCQCLKVLS